MSNNSTAKSAFDIDQSLATTKPSSEDSTAWMKKVAMQHGDTDPQKLEKRREKLSVYAQIVEDSAKGMKMQLRLFLTRNQKEIDRVTTALKKIGEPKEDKDKQAFETMSGQLAQLYVDRDQQSQSYTLLIQQAITNSAIVEGLCLIVDSLTLRDTVKSKKGKIGTLRFSSCLYGYDAADYARKSYNRTRKLYDLIAAQNPLIAADPDTKDDDDEDEGETEFDDEDVVSTEDRQNVRKEVEEPEGVEM